MTDFSLLTFYFTSGLTSVASLIFVLAQWQVSRNDKRNQDSQNFQTWSRQYDSEKKLDGLLQDAESLEDAVKGMGKDISDIYRLLKNLDNEL